MFIKLFNIYVITDKYHGAASDPCVSYDSLDDLAMYYVELFNIFIFPNLELL